MIRQILKTMIFAAIISLQRCGIHLFNYYTYAIYDVIEKTPKLLLLLEWKYIFDIVVAVILGAFSSSNEDIKTAASYALGAVAVGNLTKYLPFVLKEIDSQTKRQYLLLHSLKVLIVCQT